MIPLTLVCSSTESNTVSEIITEETINYNCLLSLKVMSVLKKDDFWSLIYLLLSKLISIEKRTLFQNSSSFVSH